MTKDLEQELPKAASALLSDWPAPERDVGFWEQSAEAVETRIQMNQKTPDALLSAPLPECSEDGRLEGAALDDDWESAEATPVPEKKSDDGGLDALAASVRPRSQRRARVSDPGGAPASNKSLAELARESMKPAATDSSLSDMAKESFSLANKARASVPSGPDLGAAPSARPLGRVASAPPSAATVAQLAARGPASAPPQSVPPQSAPVSAQPAPAAAGAGSKTPWIAGTIAVLGVAAALVLVVRARSQDTESLAVAPSQPVAAEESPAGGPPATAAPAESGVVSFDQLPSGAEKQAAAGAERVPGPLPKAGAGAKPEATEKVAAAEPPKKEDTKATKPEEKDDKLKPGENLKPAADQSNLPLKPSSGAAQAAVASVLGGARACVAGHEEASRAAITFGSSGTVQSVSVSGAAAGTPAAGCIKAALSRARVEPFQESNFTVGVTVRP